jgi:hypothetical protein
MNTIDNNKNLLELFFFFSQGKCKYKRKKEKKFSRSQKNDVRRMIFCENASFDSMNSNQAENRTL